MAANNYFNFTHGGTQYGTTATGAYNQYAAVPPANSAPGYRTGGTGYDQQTYHAAAAATPGSYANTGTPAPTYDYGYGRYDKAYYQQTPGYTGNAAASAAPATPYDNTATAGKVPGYQAPTTYAQHRPAMTGGAKVSQYSTQPTQQYATQPSYAQPQAAAPAATTTPVTTATYSNYDAALYNATTMYAAQQGKAQGNVGSSPAPSTHPYKKPGMGGHGGPGGKPRFTKPGQPKPQQLHYCEVCKISCAGPQTYREHLEGQKHKKRQAGLKLSSIGGAGTTGSRSSTLTCQLCDVACTGADAYAAHVRGSKHQKVVKLHQKLGKPIPEQEAPPQVSTAAAAPATVAKATVPKINFISESQPSMTVDGSGATATAQVTTTPEVKVDATAAASAVAPPSNGTLIGPVEPTATAQYSPPAVEVKPVGQEYIEMLKDDSGKLLSFNCKLCDCKFNDPNAKEMHMKGRRHRLQYKKKVQPDLVVDLKPSPRRLKLAEAKTQQQQLRTQRRFPGDGVDGNSAYSPWEYQNRENMSMMSWVSRNNPNAMHIHSNMFGAPMQNLHPESSDDRYVVAKHAEIYPKEDELQVIQRIVSHTERALKFVSDALAIGGTTKEAAVKEEKTEDAVAIAEGGEEKNAPKEDGRDNQMFSFHKDADGVVRVLKGVMRVGLLAKGLLLQGDTLVQLVVLCAEKPTHTLLSRVAAELPVQLANISTDHQYTVTVEKSEGAVFVTDGQITVKVSLTSPLLREQHPPDNGGAPTATQPQAAAVAAPASEPTPGGDGSDEELLPREPCLAALAALRHAKWFQARATGIQSGVMVMRVFRDLCQRTPTWNAIPQWAMELLIEKIITSGIVFNPLSPGDCVRRILEAISSGLLINGPGVLDPCEKEPTDALASLTKQQREDITVSAQHFLRCTAFRRIYQVLGMDPFQFPKYQQNHSNTRFQRKRRHSGSDAVKNESSNGTDATSAKVIKTEEGTGDATAPAVAAEVTTTAN